jgi:NAD(P)-dependent dehydrogenase (short-subunit alcohol dehydrogenase family)
MTFDFNGKNVLITGASRGIGSAIAIMMAASGARVAVHFQKNKKAASETLSKMKKADHGRHFAIRADLADAEAVKEMAEAVVKEFGEIHILVNNAGIFKPQSVEEMDFTEWKKAWQETMETNLMGSVNLTYLVLPSMLENKGGKIINISSRGAFRGEPDHPAYGASKAAMNAFGQSMAVKYAGQNIQFYTVAPGFVETDMAADYLSGDGANEVLNQYPGGKVASPEDVARTVCFLASEGNEMITGAIIDVNGASYLRS